MIERTRVIGIGITIVLCASLDARSAPAIPASGPSPSERAAESQKIEVVTSLATVGSIAGRVGGELVHVTALADPKQDPHHVSPIPSYQTIASRADLMVVIGLNLDIWADPIIQHSGNPRIQKGSKGYVLASQNCEILELPDQVSRAWGDIHPAGNPHVWLSPLNAEVIASNIADGLIAIDSAHEEDYKQGLARFVDAIDKAMFGETLVAKVGSSKLHRLVRFDRLDSYLERRHITGDLGGWLGKAKALRGLGILSYHKTYIYFAKTFGLEIKGELEEKPGLPPPPLHLDEVIRMAKRDKISVILNDNFYTTEAAEYVAKRCGAKIITTYIAVGATDAIRSYEDLIGRLLDQLLDLVKDR